MPIWVEFELVPTTGSSRIPNLLTNKADIVISSLSITPDRAKVVDFSLPYADLGRIRTGPDHRFFAHSQPSDQQGGHRDILAVDHAGSRQGGRFLASLCRSGSNSNWSRPPVLRAFPTF